MPLTEDQIRATLRPHRDGGPISRFYATGEIGAGLHTALTRLATDLYVTDRDEESERVQDVIRYVRAVGGRPAVPRWVASHATDAR